MTNSNAVGWFDIHVSDFDRAKKFYEAVFQVQLIDLPSEWGRQAMFPFTPDAPNISGAIVEKPNIERSSANVVLYFETLECVQEEERIKNAGGRILQGKMAIGEFGFVSIFTDTEGNTLGLHSRQ